MFDILSEILGPQNRIKTGKKARNSAKFEHQKLQIKYEKLCFVTLIPKGKTTHYAFSGKIFRK